MTNTPPPTDSNFPILEAVFPAYALLAGMQLDVFTALKDGPSTAEEIAMATGLDADRLERLLYALVVAGALMIKEGRFSNTPASDYFLVRGRPAFYGDSHGFWKDIWQALSRTADSIRTGAPQARYDYRQMSMDQQIVFFRGTKSGAKTAGYDFAKRYDFSTHQTVLDVAGGSGGLAVALTSVYPNLLATVVDLPEVTPITEAIIIEEAAASRVRVIAADVVDGTLSGEFDVAILRNFTQILGPDQISRALKNVFGVLKPGGVVYIIATTIDNSHTSPTESVYWNLVYVNIYENGHAYTVQQYRVWFTEAGFIDFDENERLGNQSILVARKPA